MPKPKGLQTQAKLFLIFGLLTLVAAINAVAGIVNAAVFQEKMYNLQADMLATQRNQAARVDFLKDQLAIKNMILSPEEMYNYWGIAKRFQDQFSSYIFYEKTGLVDAVSSQALDQLNGVWGNHTDGFQRIIGALEEDPSNNEEAWNIDQEELSPLADQMEGHLDTMADQSLLSIQQRLNEIDRNTQASAIFGRWAMLILGALIIWGAYTTSQIVRPLQSLTTAIVAFQNNIYKSEMLAAYTKRRDELGEMARAIDAMATAITEANRLKDRFLKSAERFIPTQYLEFLEKPDITSINLGDHVSAEMAVMFSDIRGFTTLSEKMSAQQNFDFVNEYLKLVSPMIQKHEGFIVKFLGDGMMAIFPYGVDDAVQAGIEKQEKVKEFNAMLNQRGLPSVSVGIGIHTGHMMVGMIGEEKRMQGDAFSDNVNLTSRVEGLNKFYGTSMIISEDTRTALQNPENYRMRYLGKVLVKGRQTPLGLYEVFSGLPPEVVALREATRADFERGIQLYTIGKFLEAQRAFNAVLDRDPNDKTARDYLERSFEWAERGAPANWTGVVIMDSK